MNDLYNALNQLDNLGVNIPVYYMSKDIPASLKIKGRSLYVIVNQQLQNLFRQINYNIAYNAKQIKYLPKYGRKDDNQAFFNRSYTQVYNKIQQVNNLIDVNSYCIGLMQGYFSPRRTTATVDIGKDLKVLNTDIKTYFGVTTSKGRLSLKELDELISNNFRTVNNHIDSHFNVSLPVISPSQTTFNNSIQISISASNGANVYFTTNNSKPIINSQNNTSNVILQINQTTTIRAIAEKNGIISKEISVTYTLTKPLTQKPIIMPLVRTFTSSAKIEIKASPNATIYYSKNGIPPLKNKANEYTIPFPIYDDTTVIAIADEINYSDNSEQADFVVNKQAIDVKKKKEVEIIAVDTATKYYQEEPREYNVTSVEQDNVGWDLEARKGNEFLKIEVKGLSGKCINVELTPNEFQKMQENADDYRLAIVTDTHGKPDLRIFVYNVKSESITEEGNSNNELVVDKIVGARIKE